MAHSDDEGGSDTITLDCSMKANSPTRPTLPTSRSCRTTLHPNNVKKYTEGTEVNELATTNSNTSIKKKVRFDSSMGQTLSQSSENIRASSSSLKPIEANKTGSGTAAIDMSSQLPEDSYQGGGQGKMARTNDSKIKSPKEQGPVAVLTAATKTSTGSSQSDELQLKPKVQVLVKTGPLSVPESDVGNGKRKVEESFNQEGAQSQTFTAVAKLHRAPFLITTSTTKQGPAVTCKRISKTFDGLNGPFADWRLYNNFREITKDNSTWPPKNVILQDWHVAQAFLHVPPLLRINNWKADFGPDGGYPRSSRKSKGRAMKIQDEAGNFYYAMIGHHYILCGDEGAGRVSTTNGNSYNKEGTKLIMGPPCVIQEDFEPTTVELQSGINPARFQIAMQHATKKQKLIDPVAQELALNSIDSGSADRSAALGVSPSMSSLGTSTTGGNLIDALAGEIDIPYKGSLNPTTAPLDQAKESPASPSTLSVASDTPKVAVTNFLASQNDEAKHVINQAQGKSRSEPSAGVGISTGSLVVAPSTPGSSNVALGSRSSYSEEKFAVPSEIMPQTPVGQSIDAQVLENKTASIPASRRGRSLVKKSFIDLKSSATPPTSTPSALSSELFYSQELANLLHHHKESMAYASAGFSAIFTAICGLGKLEKLSVEKISDELNDVMNYIYPFKEDLKQRDEDVQAAVFKRAADLGIDVDSVTAQVENLSKSYGNLKFDTGIEAALSPPPLRVPAQRLQLPPGSPSDSATQPALATKRASKLAEISQAALGIENVGGPASTPGPKLTDDAAANRVLGETLASMPSVRSFIMYNRGAGEEEFGQLKSILEQVPNSHTDYAVLFSLYRDKVGLER